MQRKKTNAKAAGGNLGLKPVGVQSSVSIETTYSITSGKRA